jgi:hypothetical protein
MPNSWWYTTGRASGVFQSAVTNETVTEPPTEEITATLGRLTGGGFPMAKAPVSTLLGVALGVAATIGIFCCVIYITVATSND